MSILFALCGAAVAVLFSTAGYRVSNQSRYREMKKTITYQGRVQALYEDIYRLNAMSVASFLKRAVIARSKPYQSRA